MGLRGQAGAFPGGEVHGVDPGLPVAVMAAADCHLLSVRAEHMVIVAQGCLSGGDVGDGSGGQLQPVDFSLGIVVKGAAVSGEEGGFHHGVEFCRDGIFPGEGVIDVDKGVACPLHGIVCHRNPSIGCYWCLRSQVPLR